MRLPRKFAVSLHADNLRLEHEGGVAFGGVYVWRAVRASNENEAAALAARNLEQELRSRSEVLNDPAEPLGISVEECGQLKWFSRWRGSALVFYVDTDDPRNVGSPTRPE